MFLCSLIEELCSKEENDKTGCKLNFGHECTCATVWEIIWIVVNIIPQKQIAVENPNLVFYIWITCIGQKINIEEQAK